MFIDPDNKRTKALIKWYVNEKDKGTTFNSVTGGVGPSSLNGVNGGNFNSGDGSARPDNFKLADELI